MNYALVIYYGQQESRSMRIDDLIQICTGDIPQVSLIQQELTDLVQRTPFPIWPGKAKNAHHIGAIPVLNALFREQLSAKGWQLEYKAHNGSIPDAYKEFDGVRVALEVQMANSARVLEDVAKFMGYIDDNVADVCAIILLDRKTANLCAGNVACIEHFDHRVKRSRWRYGGIPTLAFGLSEASVTRVDVSGMGVKPKDIEQGRNASLCDMMAREILKDPANVKPSSFILPKMEQVSLF